MDKQKLFLSVLLIICSATSYAHDSNKFADLTYMLRSPTAERAASGAPGQAYWQQSVSYDINVEVDDFNQRLYGDETIKYTNNSPHTLKYIWLQLHQNRFTPDSRDNLSRESIVNSKKEVHYDSLTSLLHRQEFPGGFKITKIADLANSDLKFTVVGTMLRIDLPEPLQPGLTFNFRVNWWYNIVDSKKIRARSGYEYFEQDGNYIYEIAQWFPRVAAYTDYEGWQNKQFLGSAEFTLEFGDYLVSITVPEDFIVAATGELENAQKVLTSSQKGRFERAIRASAPLFIVTPSEAKSNQASKSQDKKTWIFRAHSVRDFAFAASRKFIWDAQAVEIGDQFVTAMSFYPPEGMGLWDVYSTKAVVHTLKTYSKFTFDYPYPSAISVNGPIGGMEYPMITFNAPRPYDDGTYWDESQTDVDRSWHHSKYGLISVIIHEIGHFYFPMIVNSDEAQWTWMDEGLNSYLQFLAEQEWERDYPHRRGYADSVASYMREHDKSVPIMTDGDLLLQRGNNGYGKPASALNVLRELVIGRDVFDFAMKEYSNRWKFKRPTPTDFFRTMEDASGIDLDWFWRGWFYSTDHVDISVDKIINWRANSLNPDIEIAHKQLLDEQKQPNITDVLNDELPRLTDNDKKLLDFYNKNPDYIAEADRKVYREKFGKLPPEDQVLHNQNKLLYEIQFTNLGGIPSPLPLVLTFDDGTSMEKLIPVEVWRYSNDEVKILLPLDKVLTAVAFDTNQRNG